MEASTVIDNLLPMGNIPSNERQARELVPLPQSLASPDNFEIGP